MTLSFPGVPAGKWSWLFAAFALVWAHPAQPLLADHPVTALLNRAATANDRSLEALEGSLSREELTLAKLRVLRAKGFASWQEVAQQQVVVESLRADRQAAARFSEFIATLRKRADKTGLDRDADSEISRNGSFPLNGISLRLAEAHASAGGEMGAAQVAVRRAAHRLRAFERLPREGLASTSEVRAARQNLKDSEALVERLVAERARHQKSYEQQLDSAEDCRCLDLPERRANSELQPEYLPTKFFEREGDLVYLLQLRKNRYASASELTMLAAQLSMHSEFLQRLRTSHPVTVRREHEIELACLDVEFLQARERATQERMTILRLEELRFVAKFSEGRLRENTQNQSEVLADSAPGLLQSPAWRLHAASRRVLAASPVSTLETVERPLSNLQVPGTFQRVDSTFGEPRQIRFREPSYSDYYEFGIRRADLSPAAKNDLRSGSIPWYLPGSPTNFK